MMDNDIFYTYVYYDPSRNNEPIYVGKGKGERAWQHLSKKIQHPFIQRLAYLKKIGTTPIIGLYSYLDEEFAHFLEEELISKFGRKDSGIGPLLNLTSGGEGPAGKKCSDETRKRMSASKKGISRGPRPVDVCSKISISKTGRPGRIPTAEENAKRSATLMGHITTEETKAKIGLANKGNMPFSKGKAMSEIQKEKMRVPKKKIECPHCNQIGGNSQMIRWHFDNCRKIK